jgi:hypothetical protein
VLTRGYVRAAPGRLTSVGWDARQRVLNAGGAGAREGVVLEAFYPGRGSVRASGLRRVRSSGAPGGRLVTAVARGGDWHLHVGPADDLRGGADGDRR